MGLDKKEETQRIYQQHLRVGAPEAVNVDAHGRQCTEQCLQVCSIYQFYIGKNYFVRLIFCTSINVYIKYILKLIMMSFYFIFVVP